VHALRHFVHRRGEEEPRNTDRKGRKQHNEIILYRSSYVARPTMSDCIFCYFTILYQVMRLCSVECNMTDSSDIQLFQLQRLFAYNNTVGMNDKLAVTWLGNFDAYCNILYQDV
jgi:hypothetical protein